MKLVIETQYRENYGIDHETGLDSNYWEPKGGSTYVVENIQEFNDSTQATYLVSLVVEYSNSASMEEIICADEMPDGAPEGEPWENPTYITIMREEDATVLVAKRRLSCAEELYETYFMHAEGERSHYRYMYPDGSMVTPAQWSSAQASA